MSQPAFAVVCDNCLESAADWYAVGDRWICAGCWDPFGTLERVSEPACQDGIVREESGML